MAIDIDKEVSDVVEGLLQAQISNVDPEDHATILNRWRHLIKTAMLLAQRDHPINETKGDKVARLMREIIERQHELTQLVLGDLSKGMSGPLKH